jgi:mRNA-degrading endonuclease RelE of RelBE toxin-antitoxin system
MAFEIILAPAAAKQLTSLKAPIRSQVRDAIELHLRHEPRKVSKSRIKRLRGLAQPEYRLRVDEIRVFYDIKATEVHVLAVITKAAAEAWLKAEGTPSQARGTGESEG